MAIGTGKLKSMITKLIKEKFFGGNDWVSGNTYKTNEQALQDGWLGVALRTTTDQIKPVPIGSPFNVYDGVISTNSAPASQVVFGQRYQFLRGGFINGYRIYTITGNEYSLYSRDVATGQVSFSLSFVATSTGWGDASISPRVIKANEELDLIVIVSEPSPTPTITTLSYNYTTPNNMAAPANGFIVHPRSNPAFMNVSKFDQGGDESVFLATLAIGDIINGAGLSWSIQSISDEGGYYQYIVAPSQNGNTTGVQDFDFETKVSTPITYAEDLGFWVSEARVSGLFTSTGGIEDLVFDDNQYGIDLLVQEAEISLDWKRLSYSELLDQNSDQPVGIASENQKPLKINAPIATTTTSRYGINPPVYAINQLIDITGDYEVSVGFEAGTSVTNRSVMVGIYIDGVLQENIYNRESKDSRDYMWVYKQFDYTFTGFTDLKIQIGKGNGGGGSTVTVGNVKFKAEKI